LPIIEEAGTDLIPDLKALLSVDYSRGPWSLFGQARMIGEIDLGQAPNRIWDEPPVSAQYYFDLTGAYRWDRGNSDIDIYFTVRNLFDEEPPIIPNTAAPRFNFPTLAQYDIIGTTFTVGVRAEF
jgi:outer membrane receptor protein involved in Fe transport